jgi:uncharacterized phage-like protein YoqJ
MICAFTGPRPKNFHFKYNEKHEDCYKIKELLRECILFAIDAGYTHFVSGMAQGIDQWAAEIIIELREEFPNIKLESAVPCQGHSSSWPTDAQRRYNKILDQCDIITRVSRDKYNPYLMIKRDEYMVDKADLLIATYGGVGKGTKHTYDYALSNNKMVLEIDPINFTYAVVENTTEE